MNAEGKFTVAHIAAGPVTITATSLKHLFAKDARGSVRANAGDKNVKVVLGLDQRGPASQPAAPPVPPLP
jgi:hypothetical protein